MRAAILTLVLTASASASKPVKRTLKGCVDEKVFYSVDGTTAYRISLPAAFDVAAFEGQGVSIIGFLYPGDRFEPDEGAKPTVTAKRCPVPALRAIKNDVVVRLRIDAEKSAAAGDFVTAHTLIDKAFAVLVPPACDSFSDRAEILAREGDYKGVAKDLAVIRARKQCYVAGKVNPLLVEDVGKVLMTKGEKKLAIEAFELANKVCDGDWCRGDIKKELAEAKQK